MKAIIPAAGLGTRFLPVTKAQPKEMLPVVDTPIMQYVVEEAAAAKASEILLVTGKSKRAIEDHFDRNLELETQLEETEKLSMLRKVRAVSDIAKLFSVRQKRPRGLGHAVHCGAPFTADEPFYVLLGDIVVPEKNILSRLREVHEQTGASVIAVEPVPERDVSKYGVIGGSELADGTWNVRELVEKPPVNDAPSNLAIMGRYLLTPRVMQLLATTEPGRGNEIQLTDALVELLEHESVYAVVVDPAESFDTGSVPGWLEANLRLALADERYADSTQALIDTLATNAC
ncbi:MAG: UTP--glucose-1-phosphate uridylyltransferase GalU [Coriobacteriia bacterium]|nr:UTP--glucose-1-phosphate uridylyltransferase GalU [Coriobacteriia bacterium]